jgi:hypothetical protein
LAGLAVLTLAVQPFIDQGLPVLENP